MDASQPRDRRAVTVHGIVQGVGFRPFVFRLAREHQLSGFVRNSGGTVQIEVEGEAARLDRFIDELTTRPPPLARIDSVTCEPTAPIGDTSFLIDASASDAPESIFVSPDIATCDACLAELFDAADRRHRYPFINCTDCGPRLTIIRGAPYDRPLTTMAEFVMCDRCRAEYEDPHDRRFHAQPVACPDCGPQVRAIVDGVEHEGEAALQRIVHELREGRIAAIKGLGGFHLACDARDNGAVKRLRSRKLREEKPFAIMLADIEAVERECELSDAERALLSSARRPIVLLRRRVTSTVCSAVAPGSSTLGVMLPYTPLHHLLMRDLDGMPLVMTSGNRSDEPIAYRNSDALDRLGDVADVVLTHDRPIQVRCDDSVTRIAFGAELPMRRSRGYAPLPVTLPNACAEPILAVGGQLKNTFALARDRHAFLSQHMGDLDHYEAYRAFERDIELYEQLFEVTPTAIAHDLHPDYASTRYAEQRMVRDHIRLIPVQHHHAHMVSCMVENGLSERVIGVTFDGTGYGTDGTVWGGEFLVGDQHGFDRAAHLRCVGMPGGESAIREPWRMAVAHLLDAGVELPELTARIGEQKIGVVQQMLARRTNAPLTSSVGRLFDAVAALLGLRDEASFEGQPAIELEQTAQSSPPDGTTYGMPVSESHGAWVIDTRALIWAVVADLNRALAREQIALRFHRSIAAMILDVCRRLRETTRLSSVVLSGGTFQNVLLTEDVSAQLTAEGFDVYRHQLVPPSDGGLCLGQVAIAAARVRPSQTSATAVEDAHAEQAELEPVAGSQG